MLCPGHYLKSCCSWVGRQCTSTVAFSVQHGQATGCALGISIFLPVFNFLVPSGAFFFCSYTQFNHSSCNLRKILLHNYYSSAQSRKIGRGESKMDSVDQKGEKIWWWKNAGMKLELDYGSCIILTWTCCGLSWGFFTASPVPSNCQFKYFLGQFSSVVFHLELDKHEFLSIARGCCLWKTLGYLCSPCIPYS